MTGERVGHGDPHHLLIVEDLATVLALVMLPALASTLAGHDEGIALLEDWSRLVVYPPERRRFYDQRSRMSDAGLAAAVALEVEAVTRKPSGARTTASL